MSVSKFFNASIFACSVAFTTAARIDDSNTGLREDDQSHAVAFVQSANHGPRKTLCGRLCDCFKRALRLNGQTPKLSNPFPPFPVVNVENQRSRSKIALFKIKDSHKATLPQDHQAQFDDLSFVVFEKTDAWQSVFSKQKSSTISARDGYSLRFGHFFLERAFLPSTKAAGSKYPVCSLNPKTAARLTTPGGVLEFLQSETIPPAIPPALQSLVAQVVTNFSDKCTLAELFIKIMRKCPLWVAHTILQPSPVADSIDASVISDQEILKILSHLLLVKEKKGTFLWKTPIADCVGSGAGYPFVSMAVHNADEHIDIQHQSNIPAASFLDLSLQDFMPEMAVHVDRPDKQKDSGLYEQEHRFTERIWLNNLVRWKNNEPVARGLSVYVHCAAFLAFDKGDDRRLSESSIFQVFPDGFTHMYNLFMSLTNSDDAKVMDSIPCKVNRLGKGVQSKREFEQFCRDRLEVIRVLKANEWK